MQGSLEHFRIEELLSMLGVAQKSGSLTIEKLGQTVGMIHLESGDVVAAAAPGTDDAIDAVTELVLTGSGTFRFDCGARHEGARQKRSVAVVLNEVRSRMGTLDRGQVPDPDALLQPVNRLGSDEVRITSRDWGSLIAIGTGCTVRELAGREKVPLLTALRAVQRLTSQGFVKAVAPSTLPRIDQVEGLASLLDRAGRQMAPAAVPV